MTPFLFFQERGTGHLGVAEAFGEGAWTWRRRLGKAAGMRGNVGSREVRVEVALRSWSRRGGAVPPRCRCAADRLLFALQRPRSSAPRCWALLSAWSATAGCGAQSPILHTLASALPACSAAAILHSPGAAHTLGAQPPKVPLSACPRARLLACWSIRIRHGRETQDSCLDQLLATCL